MVALERAVNGAALAGDLGEVGGQGAGGLVAAFVGCRVDCAGALDAVCCVAVGGRDVSDGLMLGRRERGDLH